MDFVRIGDKLISRNKIENFIDRILEMRVQGLSQQEVAKHLNIDRSFISRLERLGEVRKGQRIAIVGFPLKNKEELQEVIEEEGVDFHLLMTEEERWQFVREKSGLELFNEIMDLIAKVRAYDVVIFLGSNKRIKFIEALLDKEVISVEIGKSPIEEDKYVDPSLLKEIIQKVKA
ncbi:helix-turn-helix domain-containing protein [Calderihabitans maritimus]|uniref:Helix-turn-helix domain-containing protein n=1 Tax=Calderihabitans maritimus TaxID=1246530 RepID=A0A1Z5HU71_9FIRM|nr:helix-turn-helix transcriptional regulator [Calderihabitans maritimus]GAW92881.1 helix-turn-helix domain-containing protein [Calderihabitans maritimus]